MKLPPDMVRGALISRYKRFLADVRLDSGEVVTAACPNTGSMLGLTTAGTVVWLSRSDNKARKYPHTWEMLELESNGRRVRVGINTGRPNAIVEEAIAGGNIGELQGYEVVRREVRYGRNSRIDLLLEAKDRSACYVEIKNVHLLRRDGLAEFPDSPTERGIKHLEELSAMVRLGYRAVMLYLVQRDDASRFSLAGDLDSRYAASFALAAAAGVEAIAYGCRLSPDEIVLDRPLPIVS
ncbi:MAG: DNA/RNA nuclease SfsA [Pseudomonadota bacterium]|nr:DNA/RNA nuclease SfsA [Pseudomonadota bacterium]